MGRADFAIVNARVYTGDPGMPWAEGLSSSDGRIVAVGRMKDVEASVGPGAAVLDAGGRLVLPGFIDAHVHLVWGFELGSWIDLEGRPSLEEVRRRVAACARDHPEEEILLGHGFDYDALDAGRLPTKEDLDDVVSDRPAILTAYDGHTGWGNSRFVARALETMSEAGREIGEMQRDPGTGEPTGLFLRTFDLTPLLPEIRRRQSVDGLRRTVAAASAFGITTAFDVQVNEDDLHAYEELRAAGGLVVRMRIALYHPAGTTRDAYPRFQALSRRARDEWIDVGAIKLYIDGVPETRSGALLKAYEGDPSSRGPTVYEPAEFEDIVRDLDARGFQICTHATGDRGVRIALDAYASAARTNGTSGRRHRIEHCENVDPEDVPRFARLGVVPCMMPRHASPDLTSRWREALGPERTARGFPWRSLLATGAALAFASDWPVASLNPLVEIQDAVVRRNADGGLSSGRLTLEEAIHAYTRGAAYACFAESTRGTLEKGKFADLVVLSKDLFQLPGEDIGTAKVLRTVVGGRIVHTDGAPLG